MTSTPRQLRLRLFFWLLATIFVAEGVVILVLPEVHHRGLHALLDSALLVILIAPVLWWLQVGPLYAVAQRQRQSAEKMLRAVEQSAETVVITDLGGHIEYVNPMFWVTTGYRAEEVIGKNPRMLKSGRMPPAEYQRLWESISRGETWRGEFHNRRKDGTLYWEQASISGIRNDQGKVTHYLAVKQDITERRRQDEVLRTYSRALECSASSVVITLADGTIQYVNAKFCEVSGYAKEEVIGKSHRMLPAALVDPELYRALWETVRKGHEWRGELLNRRKDGTHYWVSASMAPVRDERGGITHCVALHEEITQRKLMEEEARLAAQVFEASSEGILISDAQNRIVKINPAFSTISGYSPEEVVGKNPSMLGSGRHDADFFRGLWQQLLEKGQWRGEIWNRRKSGEVFPEWLSIALIKDAAGEVLHHVAVFSDITLRKQQEESVLRLAHYDLLTGLPNRALMLDRLEQACRRARRQQRIAALLFLDLDGFKGVNDAHGHAVGDLLLVEVARRMETCVRDSDTVSRLGGDEFVVILPELAFPEDPSSVANKLLELLSRPYRLGSVQVTNVSASIGVSLFPDDGGSAAELLDRADQAMYRVKQGGKAGVAYGSASRVEPPGTSGEAA